VAYYYLMAQLPYLVFDQRPPMSCEAFKALAAPMLSKTDLKLLSALALDPDPEKLTNEGKGPSYSKSAEPCGCRFIDKWKEWERTLRLSLAKNRAIKSQLEMTEMVEPPFFPVEANQVAAKALSQELSPLDGETVIDKARWAAIENLAGNDYFDRNNVFAYYLKLLLLERRQSFNVEKGFAEYKSLYAAIVEQGRSLPSLDGAHSPGESK
jgi:hypothetical protein